MSVSIVIPARNAAATLPATLASVVAQGFGDWEAIVVDDASDDRTAAVAQAMGDSRIRVIAGPGQGVSAARNAGIAAAGGGHVLFLDADDDIAPDYLARLHAAAGAGGIAYCGYRRITPAGTPLEPRFAGDIALDPVAAFADHCQVAIHCVLAPLDAVRRAGGFDPILAVCEDWDLWLRLARMGLGWHGVDAPLARYRMRSGSLSGDHAAMARDGMAVIARARQPDPRLPDGGIAVEGDGRAARTMFWLWCAVAGIAAGEAGATWTVPADIVPLFGMEPALWSVIHDAVCVGGAFDEAALPGAWPAIVPGVQALLRAVGAATDDSGLARRVMEAIELPLVRAGTLKTGAVVMGASMSLETIAGIEPPPGVDRLVLSLTDHGRPVGGGEYPLWGAVSARDMLDLAIDAVGLDAVAAATPRATLAAGLALGLVGAPHRHGRRYGALAARLSDATMGERSIVRRDALLSAHPPAPPVAPRAAPAPPPEPPADTDPVAWDRFYAAPDPWRYDHPYEARKHALTLQLIDDAGDVLEIGCGEGHFTRQLLPIARSVLAIDVSAMAIARARTRAPDARFARIDLADWVPEGPFDTIVASETLYYLPPERLPAILAALAGALRPGGRLVMANIRSLADDPRRTGFDIALPFAGDHIVTLADATPGLVRERGYDAGAYRIDRWRRADATADAAPVVEAVETPPPPPWVAGGIVPGGMVMRRGDAFARESVTQVPVLAYHRVANDGPVALARWRIAPDAFAEQIALLRRHGYYHLGAAQFDWYRQHGRPIPGRPVMLSFDDAYCDFADTAWPILRGHAMGADLYVVVDRVGGSAAWDRTHGTPAPLLDWDRLAALAEEGVQIGSHLCSHRRADGLSSADLLVEAARSRQVIAARTGAPVDSVALPYGYIDGRIVRVLAAAGVRTAFSTAHGIAALDANPLALPRIEVAGDWPIDRFAAALGIAA